MTIDVYIGEPINKVPELPHEFLGTEKIPIGGRGKYHVTTQKLKNWILTDLTYRVNLGKVDNTSDLMKPLSLIQEPIIDSKITALRNMVTPRLDHLTENKADLLNGVIPLTQLPLQLRDDNQIVVNMAAIRQELSQMVDNSNILVNSEIARNVLEHEEKDDPHSIKPYVDEAVSDCKKELKSNIESLDLKITPTVEEFVNSRLSLLPDNPTITDLINVLKTPVG